MAGEQQGNMAMHSMQMSFEASTKVTLWFKQWHTHNWGTYIASCLGLCVLCLLNEALTSFRSSYHQQNISQSSSTKYERLSTAANGTVEAAQARKEPPARFLGKTKAQALYSLMYAANLTLAYLLMLAVMTYNVGYFVIIICSLALGNFIFSSSTMASDVCHPEGSGTA
jgi:hypothetical protein